MDNLKYCLGHFARLVVAQFTINDVILYGCPLISECEFEIDTIE